MENKDSKYRFPSSSPPTTDCELVYTFIYKSLPLIDARKIETNFFFPSKLNTFCKKKKKRKKEKKEKKKKPKGNKCRGDIVGGGRRGARNAVTGQSGAPNNSSRRSQEKKKSEQ